MTILVTGGAGFIGSNFVLDWLRAEQQPLVNLDKVTYAGNPANLDALRSDPRYTFVRGDIADAALVRDVLARYRPSAIVHLAAESHVDRSICAADAFVQTNVVGTTCLLENALAYWQALSDAGRRAFRFLHVSTDEVFGSLAPGDSPFSETSAYAPNNPYAASKAASDHFVRAYAHTYGLPVFTTHCSNNYGPLQFPEKLIPLAIVNALAGKPLPLYGDGLQVRDWLYVADHCAALRVVLARGAPGESYNIGGWNEKTNLDVVNAVCKLLDEERPAPAGKPYEELITCIADRPGHDRRYAIDAGKIERELGWRPAESFDSGLRKTVQWYLANPRWVSRVTTGEYLKWIEAHYRGREVSA
jgi:dTDP-glucose 4,6-dehydratase